MRTLLTFALSLAAYAGVPATVDRVAVVVGNRAITESRIEEDIRLTAFLNGEEPQFDDASRRGAAGRLIERLLLQREIIISGFAATTSLSAASLNDIRGRYLDEPAFLAALKTAQLSEELLKAHLEDQARILTFIDFRFRPEVAIDEPEARDFYTKEYPAYWMALHGGEPIPPFDEARDDVDRLLIDRKVDAEMERFLSDARTQTRIDYREKELQPVAASAQGAAGR